MHLFDIQKILSCSVFRRQVERNKLAREKQLREAAEREKAVMEQKLLQYQEEMRLANEALVCKYVYIQSAFKYFIFAIGFIVGC